MKRIGTHTPEERCYFSPPTTLRRGRVRVGIAADDQRRTRPELVRSHLVHDVLRAELWPWGVHRVARHAGEITDGRYPTSLGEH